MSRFGGLTYTVKRWETSHGPGTMQRHAEYRFDTGYVWKAVEYWTRLAPRGTEHGRWDLRMKVYRNGVRSTRRGLKNALESAKQVKEA